MYNLNEIEKALYRQSISADRTFDDDDDPTTENIDILLHDSELEAMNILIYPESIKICTSDGFLIVEKIAFINKVLEIAQANHYTSKEYVLSEMGAHPGLYYSPVHNDIRTMDDWVRFICGDSVEDRERRRSQAIPDHEKEVIRESQRQKMSKFAFNKVIKVECEIAAKEEQRESSACLRY